MSDLSKYDIIVMIDKSGSMSASSGIKGMTRWKLAEDYAKRIATVAAGYDDDGIDLVVFDDDPKLFEGITPGRVTDVFQKNHPGGCTDTAAALKLVFDRYFGKGKKGLFGMFSKEEKKSKPIIVICITDGEPNDKDEVAKVIIDATKKIDNEEEIGVSFIQVGNDSGARKFLKFLDDELVKRGAKFDIVDCKDHEEMENMSVEDILMGAVND